MMRRVLLVSRHDYRTSWRANFHPIADAFAALGDQVSFVSVGYSPLSRFSQDQRRLLDARSNRWERIGGVDCFLWKAPFHPIGLGRAALDRLMKPVYRLFTRLPADELDRTAAAADLIVVESGLSPVLIPRLRRRAPDVPIVYLASDLFGTIGAPAIMDELLFEARQAISTVVVVARAMAPHLRHLGRPIRYVPHGIDTAVFDRAAPSPYSSPSGRNVVTVGSMLFDPQVFTVAATAFPNVSFHLIGTPSGPVYPRNVQEHGTMAFDATVPWLQHADVGVAPYRYGASAEYLSDSSMKLMQYGYLGLPALCPDFAAGEHALRFGYSAGDPDSIVAALAAALEPAVERRSALVLSWTEVAERLADPRRFADTAID